MNKLKALFILVLLTGVFLLTNAQNPSYFSTSGSLTGTVSVNSGIINLTPIDKTISAAPLRESNISAKLNLKLDLGDDYVKVAAPNGFIVTVVLTINNSLPQQTIVINDKTPEVVKTVDVMPFLSTLTSPLSVSVSSTITDNEASPLPLPAGLLKNYIDNNLRLTATLVREYAVDVRTVQGGNVQMSFSPVITPVTSASISFRKVSFSWQPVGVDAYPNYELQILKLENTDETKKNDDNEITADVDWTKALRVETQSSATSIALTMAEGTGFYIWRVRPIGTYFEGGIANSENYGEWSSSGDNTAPVVFNKNTLTSASNPTPYAFYFTDPDQDINWIYNRVFTEADNDPSATMGVKVSEGINYADGLLRSRQSQTYNSSNGKTIVSQTVSDYSGRPALTTLPVPISGGLTGYKVDLVKNSSGTLYTAAAYDNDLNVQAPSTVEDATSAFSYYSDNNADKTIPNADGYPFKRTLFKADGTGRVDEESGVGKVHALGTITNGNKRTTRILYGSPSDDELIRIFGDEAPLSESVIKTTTIDPNNVISVTYTSKEGKTIATALGSESTNNLVALEKAPATFTVTNTADQNILSGGKFVSSKRIVVPYDNFDIALSYSLTDSASGCVSCNYRVKFYLVDLRNNHTYTSDADNADATFQDFDFDQHPAFSGNWEFRVANSASLVITPSSNNIKLNTGEYLFIKEVYAANDKTYAENKVNTFNDQYHPILDAIAGKIMDAKSKQGSDALNTFLVNLSGFVTVYHAGGVAGSPNQDDILKLLGFMDPACTTSCVILPDKGIPSDYKFPLDFTMPQYTVDPTPGATANTLTMSIGSAGGVAGCPSCSSIEVKIPKPDICYACDGDGSTLETTAATMTVVNTASLSITPHVEAPYGIEDIRKATDFLALSDAAKRDAIDAIVQRYFIDLLNDKLTEEGLTTETAFAKIAPGFYRNSSTGDMPGLKFMLSNMLISRYYTGYGALNSGNQQWYVADPAGVATATTVVSYISSSTFTFNYDCKKLLTAWTTAVNLLGSVEAGDDVNVVKHFNDEDGSTTSAEDNADDESNWEDLSNHQKKKLKRKLSREMDDFNDSDEGKVPTSKIEALINLPNTFMNNAGYQFASVIDGDALPGYVPVLSTNTVIPADYNDYAGYRPATGSVVVTYTLVTADAHTGVPVLADDYSCDGDVHKKALVYPYILKPEWMFKYFVYNVYDDPYTNQYHTPANFIGDQDFQIPNQVILDLQWCYNKPSYYIAYDEQTTTLCNITCGNFLHNNWSSAERLNFYQQISGAPKCWKNKGVNKDDQIGAADVSCENKETLVAQARAELDFQTNACADKANEIRDALVAELVSSCYTIVPCKSSVNPPPDQITDKEINYMVQRVIQECQDEIGTIRTKLNSYSVTPTSPYPPYGPGNDVNNYPYCEQTACKDIYLDKSDGSLFLDNKSKILTYLFPDCDKNILTMLNDGSFLPDIPSPENVSCPNYNVNSHPKEWQSGSNPVVNQFTTIECPPGTTIGKAGNPSSATAKYSSYSEPHPISATVSGQ